MTAYRGALGCGMVVIMRYCDVALGGVCSISMCAGGQRCVRQHQILIAHNMGSIRGLGRELVRRRCEVNHAIGEGEGSGDRLDRVHLGIADGAGVGGDGIKAAQDRRIRPLAACCLRYSLVA